MSEAIQTAAALPDDRDDYRLAEQIGFILRKASQRHGAIFSRLMIPDITPTQWAALVALSEQGPLSQNHLGRETAMDNATIKGVVDRLAKRGLVTTADDPSDIRRTMIDLSEEGRDIVRSGRPLGRQITEETFGSLAARDRKRLLGLLAAIG